MVDRQWRRKLSKPTYGVPVAATNVVTINSILSAVFPVGYVYISTSSTNPGTSLGFGTWALTSQGYAIVGFKAADADFGTAGATVGAKSVASAGSVAAPSISGSTASATTGATVGNHAAHTHAYTQVLNHTHAVNITDPGHAHTTIDVSASWGGPDNKGVAGTDATNDTTAGAVTDVATTGITATTGNPSGGVASGTTGNPSATLTHSVTDPGHTHGAGTIAAGAPSFTGSATSVIQPSMVFYVWERTA